MVVVGWEGERRRWEGVSLAGGGRSAGGGRRGARSTKIRRTKSQGPANVQEFCLHTSLSVLRPRSEKNRNLKGSFEINNIAFSVK